MRPPFIEPFFGGGFGLEIIYSFVIIVCSLMVYYGTKELYDLSKYKGIKYFRYSFLFFAIAYFFRSMIKYLMMLFNFNDILEFSPMLIGAFSIFVFMYFSSIAVFYLLYSVIWKNWNGKYKLIYIFHLLALIIGVLSAISHDLILRFFTNLILFIFIIIIIVIVYRESKIKKKKNNLFIIYLLLFVFWLLNIIDILIPRFLEGFRLVIYLFSILIFLLILYKVIKRTGS